MVFTIADVLNQWQSIGVFSLLLPWLLVFAVVFGILNTTRILGSHKGVQAIIGVVIASLSLQYNYLGDFLSVLAPNLGVGISVILAIMICVGLFIPKDERRYWLWGLGAIAFVVVVVIITDTFSTLGYTSIIYSDYAGYIIGAVLLIGLIIAVAAGGRDDEKPKASKGVAVMAPFDVE